uniref:Protein kinase domain-containing protein n=2 Tax=Glycine max TaxID=3847 RepID=A0A0R0GLS3_SOYBN
MKTKLLLMLLMLLLILHKPTWILASAYPLAPSPQVPPFSPFPTSMSASSPGIVMGAEQQHMDSHKKMVIAVAVASTSLGAVILCVLCIWIYYTKYPSKSKGKNVQRSDAEKGLASSPFLSKFSSIKLVGKKGCVPIIDYKQIEKTTGNFEEINILGEGGFGCVYKAHLDDNLDVAVKKLHCENQYAEQEFENEVDLLSKIQHPNVISLLGCSSNDDTRIIVYELMHNGSLETQLHGPSHGSALTWHLRMKIALDTARGLKYLHEHCYPPVIHRDLKSSNVLLDTKFNAKLSDFGLAITNGSQNKNNLKLSGTLGYVAPEYLLDGKLTDKSDVYAFGVVLLELLLGKKPVEKLAPAQCQSIVTWVAAVAVLCVQPEPSYRPLIADVLHSLIPLVPVELGGTLKVSQLPQQV